MNSDRPELAFEWNKNKAKMNIAKHKVSFEEARTVFNDPFLITFPDECHSENEERLTSIGISTHSRMLLVIHTECVETEKSFRYFTSEESSVMLGPNIYKFSRCLSMQMEWRSSLFII